MSIKCNRKLTDLTRSNGVLARKIINIVPPTSTPDIQLIVIQEPHINFWEKRDESENDVLYISAHKKTLTDNIPYFEAAFRESSNWVDNVNENQPSSSKKSKTGCGSICHIQTYTMTVTFKPDRLAEYLKKSLHDEYLCDDDDQLLCDYLSISSFLLDKSVFDDLLEMVEDCMNIYNYIDYLNVQISKEDCSKAIKKIVNYLIGESTGRSAIILSQTKKTLFGDCSILLSRSSL